MGHSLHISEGGIRVVALGVVCVQRLLPPSSWVCSWGSSFVCFPGCLDWLSGVAVDLDVFFYDE